jgi:hypothetical protein
MNVMKSLDVYEQLFAPVRECFAVSPGLLEPVNLRKLAGNNYLLRRVYINRK